MTDAAPHAIPDEEAVLGAILISKTALQAVVTDLGLKAEHFYLDKHRGIFAAALRVAADEGFADELTIAARLPELREYLATLAARSPAVGNVRAYTRRIIEVAGLRAKHTGALTVLEGIREQDQAKIQEGVLGVSADVQAESEPSSPDELAEDMWEWLNEEPDERDVLPLPWKGLADHCAGGYRRGQMVLVTGWSGYGKSLVTGQMMPFWASQGNRCLLLTTEMKRREIVARFLASETGIAYEKIIRRRLSKTDWPRINKAIQQIPFHYHDAEGWSVDRILSAIVTKRPDVAIIDPANLIPRKDYHEVTEHARRLKEIAAKANCCVVVVVHLKDRPGQRDGKLPRPTKSDIRDSGMWYTNAHSVLCLHREQNDQGKPQRKGELYFMKSRDAPEGGIEVEFRPRVLRFDPVGTEEAEKAAAEPELFA
jgi:replicative DNA helicase